jgi:hypothetical protein
MERQKPYLMAVCTSDFKLDARRKKKTDLCSYAGQAQILPFSFSLISTLLTLKRFPQRESCRESFVSIILGQCMQSLSGFRLCTRVMSVYQKVVYMPYHPQAQGL